VYIESANLTLAEREEFQRVSLDWHRVLQFKSGWKDIVDGEEIKRQAEVRQETGRSEARDRQK